jgi:hypothetical protein
MWKAAGFSIQRLPDRSNGLPDTQGAPVSSSDGSPDPSNGWTVTSPVLLP